MWAGHIECMRRNEIHSKFNLGNIMGIDYLENLEVATLENNIKMDLREILVSCVDMKCIELDQYTVH
jgi:hypothetical protein